MIYKIIMLQLFIQEEPHHHIQIVNIIYLTIFSFIGIEYFLKYDFIALSTNATGSAIGILPKGGSIIGSSTNSNVFNFPVEENGEIVYGRINSNTN